ncbi:hypothetical protein HRD57_05005 [Tetragenococcus halophilus]|nr:hypothetical protein [Tetragenococcus halophilus]
MDKKKKIDLLSELIQVKSVNGDEKDVAEILKRELDDAGIANEILPFGNNRANLVATLGHGHPVLAVSTIWMWLKLIKRIGILIHLNWSKRTICFTTVV